MRTALHHSLLIAAVAMAIPAPSFAQKADMKAEALKDWNDLKGVIVKLAAEMPEDKYGFKPTPAQRNFGARLEPQPLSRSREQAWRLIQKHGRSGMAFERFNWVLRPSWIASPSRRAWMSVCLARPRRPSPC